MKQLIITLLFIFSLTLATAQIIYRPLPAEWEKLVDGGNFMDRFLPMPEGKLSDNVWGVNDVLPRYIDNGIEDDSISYWGGNIVKGNDGLYHMFLCGWNEDNPDGHMGYKKYSTQYHAVCHNSIGPFKIKEVLGEGHNTEILQLKDGRFFIYHVTGDEPSKHCNYLISDNLNGPWEKKVLNLDLRDRPTRLGGGTWFHNMTFTKREDGSVLMMSRMGAIWVSETGISPYHLITEKSIYPLVSGKYEDPVIWKDHIQYNAIVNDWLGRTAFYLRSKDGVNWINEDGRAYIPGISSHKDGRKENWYKYERIRIYQDKYGRAIQANFAVIDTLKHSDLPNDKYSSKNISIPMNPGMLLSLENKQTITFKTRQIKVRIRAEKDFKPIKEVNVESLRFGAHSEVNYGRGAIALNSEQDGEDLLVTFEAKNHCIGEDEFAPKVIGRDNNGNMLFGYMRLPWVNYIEAILSARKPIVKNGKVAVVIDNHGQVDSRQTILSINGYDSKGMIEEWGSIVVPVIKPYGRETLEVDLNKSMKKNNTYSIVVKILSQTQSPVLFHTDITW